MSTWSETELAAIGDPDELQIATRRRDGTLRPERTVWVVRLNDELYVRSVNGRDAAWFRGTRTQMAGHVRTDAGEHDVEFVDTDDGRGDDLDRGYRSKYRRYSAGPVDRITSAAARSATLRLVPR